MPNRILREGILTSPRIARLGWAEEVFYRRLHSVVDDFGRYYADPGMLRAACYPRQLSKVSDSDIGKWLTVLVEAALVRVYPASDGERYLEVLDFGQQVRAKKSKFPDMPSVCVADAQQVPANAHLDVSVSVSEIDLSGGFEDFWKTWPKSERKQDRKKCLEKWQSLGLHAVTARILADVETKKKTNKWAQGFIEAPEVYINNRRWEDGALPDSEPGGEWHETRAGVEAMGESLGLGRWQQTEQFSVFRDRVIAAHTKGAETHV